MKPNTLAAVVALLALTGLLLTGAPAPEQKVETADFQVHEWGTFTTLHSSNGLGLAWYQRQAPGIPQPQNPYAVSDLPSFVFSGGLFQKGMTRATARMETPVIYFYTEEPRTLDIVSVGYEGGQITEYYPGRPGFFSQWKNLELVPPAQAGDLLDKLPTDPKRPDNHYFEARDVPEAAVLRYQLPADKEGNQPPAQLEKFLFYRGMGSFSAGLNLILQQNGALAVQNYNQEHALKHSWALQTTAEAVRWQKLEPIAAYNNEEPTEPVTVQLKALPAGESKEASIAALVDSMVAALVDSGLTQAEAAAMVATWDEQWYGEPGQRVFSITPQPLIEEILPLHLNPAPSEKPVRVFVHRAEILSPETELSLESALDPGADIKETMETIASAQLGRFIYGAIEATAETVGRRTTNEYRNQGFKALALAAATEGEKKEGAAEPASEVASAP